MKHGTYNGPVAHLRGKSALLQPCSALRDCVLAQFDDRDLTRSGKPLPRLTVLDYEPHARFPTEQLRDYPEPPADALGFGWHAFPHDHFTINQETENHHGTEDQH